MITVHLPTALGGPTPLDVAEPVATLGELVEAIERRRPGFRDQMDDAVFNFAVNDEMVLFRARDRELRDGDVVEVVPAISGGSEHHGDDHGNEQDGDQGLGIAGEIEFEHWRFRPFHRVRRRLTCQGLVRLVTFL